MGRGLEEPAGWRPSAATGDLLRSVHRRPTSRKPAGALCPEARRPGRTSRTADSLFGQSSSRRLGQTANRHQPVLPPLAPPACRRVLYHGPVADVLSHFSALGFQCPSRKEPPSFLQASQRVAGPGREQGSVKDSWVPAAGQAAATAAAPTAPHRARPPPAHGPGPAGCWPRPRSVLRFTKPPVILAPLPAGDHIPHRPDGAEHS